LGGGGPSIITTKERKYLTMAKRNPKRSNVVELSWHGNSPDIHCPACGKDVFGSDDKCDHLLLVTCGAGFDYVRPDLKKLADRLEEKDESPFELADKVRSERAFFLSIITSGVACGPVSFEMLVGFEFPERQRAA
jgi:hypothetical protein